MEAKKQYFKEQVGMFVYQQARELDIPLGAVAEALQELTDRVKFLADKPG